MRFFRHFRGALDPDDLRGKVVLDVGCGYGGRTVYYKKACDAATVHGIEIAERMVDRCRQLAVKLDSPDTTFSLARAEQLPFDDESFDVVLSFDVLEHCDNPKLAVREMTRVLRPGGALWNVFPTYKGARSSHVGYINNLPGLHRLFHPDTIVEVINEFLSDPTISRSLGTKPQPAPTWSSLGHYPLPALNGLTLKEARRIFSSTEGLICNEIIVTPMIDRQLSRDDMEDALGSSKMLTSLARLAAYSLDMWQRRAPLPELLVQNIAVMATKG